MNRKTLLFIFLFASISLHKVAAQKSIFADSTKLVIDGQLAPFNTLLPGDTILLGKGIRPFIIFKNIIGDVHQSIIIINQNGCVEINSDHYFGISIRKSKYLKLSGNGDTNHLYGIRIFNRIGSGLSIGDFTSDFEIENIEIGYSQYSGITAKTEPFCGFDRNSFIQENSHIHHCYVHHTGTEGMYIGSTFYAGQTVQCTSGPMIVMPALLRNVNVHHNKVEYTGWDGIQVSSAVNASIHHNLIKYDSQQLADWQMTGITLGEGSTGQIFNNEIMNGEGMGIYTKALGDVLVYNNKIIRPGMKNNLPSGKYGIYIDGKASLPGMYFHVLNNLIINPKFEGIRYINGLGGSKNGIINNVIVQESYLIDKDKAVFINTNAMQVLQSNNYTSTDLSSVRFKNTLADDYTTEEGSILIDGGSSLEHLKIEYDFDDQARIKGNSIDIGPYESSYNRNNIYDNSTSEYAYPNPVSLINKTTISFNNPDEGWIEFVLVSQNGSELKTIDRNYFEKGVQIKIINANVLLPGLNYVVIRKRMSSTLLRISVFKD